MLTHKGTETLETERLILRKFAIDDAEAMYNNWSSDEEVAKYMMWDHHKDIKETREVLANRIKRYDDPSTYHWVIVLKEVDMPIGTIGLMVSNEQDMCGTVAYCVSRKYWGQGIVTEALKEVLRFGFTEVNFNRIEAYHAINNIGSGRVMQKCGMRFEGRMRQKYRSHVGFEDSDLYAMLKEDFNEIISLK